MDVCIYNNSYVGWDDEWVDEWMYNYKDNIYNDFVDPSIKRYVYIESVIDDVMGSSHCIYDIDNDDNNNDDDVDDDIGDDDIDDINYVEQ